MITHLSLRNFKCFEQLDLKVGQLTLLSGLNGMGKSSVIQAMLLLRQSWQQGLLARGQLALNGDLVQIGTAQDALYGFAEDEEISFATRFSGGEESQWDFSYDKSADILARKATFTGPSDLPTESIFGSAFQYLSAERLGPRASSAISDVAVRHRRELGIRGEYTAQFLNVFSKSLVSLEKLRHPKATALTLGSQVEAWMDVVSPGTRLRVTPHSAIDVVQLQYQFESGRDLTDAFRPTNVGFGLSFVLPVLVSVLAAPLDALLLIENPEAHLHPRGQVAMGRFLSLAAASGAQVILETHSDHLLNGIRLAVHSGEIAADLVSLHFFERVLEAERAKHRVVSPTIDRNGRIDRWPAGFFDEWEHALDGLLGPGKQ